MRLFFLFAKFSMLCFGGGYMLIPLIILDCVEKYHYLTLEQFGNLLSVAQMTPGPIAINTATYVGFIQGGFWGSLLATTGIIAPTFLLGCTVGWGIQRWKNTLLIRGILRGTRLSAQAMICYAVTIFMGMSIFTKPIPWRVLLGQDSLTGFGINPVNLVIAGLAAAAVAWNKCSVTWVILGGAVLGMLTALL